MQPIFETTSISFGEYFWTPIPFILLFGLIIIESYFASRYLKQINFDKTITTSIIFSSIITFFLEYYLSILMNGGQTIMVYIPWIKILGTTEQFQFISAVIYTFFTTLLIQTLCNYIFLRPYFKLKKILTICLTINIIRTFCLLLIFNFFLFNYIKGFVIGLFDN